MTTEEEYTQWHDDGHEMTVEVCIGVHMAKVVDRPLKQRYVSTELKVHCPEDSFCHRWAKEHDAPHHCFVKSDIDAVGHWDFIEMMDLNELPDDWSSSFPIRLAWRDQGEDGIVWRPSESPLTRFFSRKASPEVAQS